MLTSRACWLVVLVVGCSSAPNPRMGQVVDAGGAAPEAAAPIARKDALVPPAGKQAKKEPAERKIISTATLRLVVEDFGAARAGLAQSIKTRPGAIVAHADQTGSSGSPRSGTWTVRVPVPELDAFVAEVSRLGEVVRNTLDARDVTEEFYDVEADIRNKKIEEEAFLNLEKNATTFDHILAAKREVQRVRTEIDRLQKRMSVLTDLTSLATVNLTLTERKDYVPEATHFTGTLARTWYGSLEALLTFGKNLLLVLVAVVPWLVVLAVVGCPVAWWVRRRWRAAEPPVLAPAEGDR